MIIISTQENSLYRGIAMAKRPAFFVGDYDSRDFVKKESFNFTWYPGFAITQKQKSIQDFHNSIQNKYKNISVLEISSKSKVIYGIKLSAFNLSFKFNGRFISVESAFQSSKVFENGGPYIDILYKSSLEAKKDYRIKNGKNLLYFSFFKEKWDLVPTTLFYDWIYLKALTQPHNKNLADYILKFDCFTDIEFNPEKSFNCQAGSVALYKYLYINNLLDIALSSRDNYINIINNKYFHPTEEIIKKNTKMIQGELLTAN